MTRRSRRTTAGRRREAGAGTRVPQLPWCTVRNPYPPFEIASSDEIESIHAASLDVLEEIGINFLLDEARDILKVAGVAVEAGSTRVRLDRSFVEEQVGKAPAQWTLHARNPARNRIFGGNYINFSCRWPAIRTSRTLKGEDATATSRTIEICYVCLRSSTRCMVVPHAGAARCRAQHSLP